MKKLCKLVIPGSLAGFVVIVLSSHVGAEETIIQQENISFEKCLKVITTSQDKLSVAPKINDDEDEREDFGEFEDDTYENLENKVL